METLKEKKHRIFCTYIKDIIEDEKKAPTEYGIILAVAPTKGDKKKIQRNINDEKRHYKVLKELYRLRCRKT